MLEGLVLGMLATGSTEGWVFIRHEYEPEEDVLREELERMRGLGLLDEAGVTVDIFTSPGGYILGEESALIECMEGHRGEPRNKPPFPGVAGLWGKPTLMNSVETFAHVPVIAERGADWGKAQGVNDGTGLKFFAVSGHVENPDVYCVPMGTTAQDLIERSRSKPQGIVRVSCPPPLLYFQVGEMIARFMAECPDVEVHLDSTPRRVDVISEGIDVALRVRFPPLEQSDLVMRVLADSTQRLVASPAVLRGLSQPLVPADLAGLPSLGWGPPHQRHEWCLDGPSGATALIPHTPRLITEDMVALRFAALRGIGVAHFPTMVVGTDLANGRLVDVLPDWTPRAGIIHAVFSSRRGLLPSVRALLDFLAAEFAALTRADSSVSPQR